jgi:NADPH-dependent F420 reductase
MHVAIVGGTGDLGEGLAVRLGLCTDHEVVIGSRNPDRARDRAAEYRAKVDDTDTDVAITGTGNKAAARPGNIVILSVPPYHVRGTVEALADSITDGETLLVTPAIGISNRDGGVRYDPPEVGSVTEFVAEIAPPNVPVVGAFHNLPAERLADPSEALDMDTVLVGDSADAKRTVSGLIDEIEGLSPVDAGPITNAPEVETLTPLLINLTQYNEDLDNAGARFS